MTNDDEKYIIIGSGPSAISCAHALIEKGIKPLLIDYGDLPPKDHQFITNENRRSLLGAKDFKWTDSEENEDIVKESSNFKEQYFYKSSSSLVKSTENSVLNISLAKGGLSNLWGGACLPVDKDDIDSWPIGDKDLEPYYKKVAGFMKISGEKDSFQGDFNPKCTSTYRYPLRGQVKHFLEHLDKGRDLFSKVGVRYGRSHLAIDPSIDHKDPEYNYGPIFNGSNEINRLVEANKIDYLPGIKIQSFSEEEGKVNVSGIRTSNNRTEVFKGKKVFIATGPVSTALIVMNSTKQSNIKIKLKTNQNVFLPFLTFRRFKKALIDNDLAQAFIEIKNKNTSDRNIHVQVYEYGDYILEPIKRIFGDYTKYLKYLFAPIFERIIVFQVMLHSDFSDEVYIQKCDESSRVISQGISSKVPRNKFKNMIKFINSKARLFGGFTSKLIMFVDPPGASNHLGCSFPMSLNPKGIESDTLGRINSCENVHIVDSSILPSLPAPTITYTIMANAYRIAETVSEKEQSCK